jgi:hypothetical protein
MKALTFPMLALMLSWQSYVQADPAKGPLTVCKPNPRYFADGSGRAVYLTGSSCGWEMQDDAWSGYSAPGTHVKFDFIGFLDLLATHHHNYVRLWIVESTRSDRGPADMLATPMPFLRTGPGNALDGRPRFDLTRYDPEFFDRLRSRVRALGDRGIYVGIMLFEGFGSVHDASLGPNSHANPWLGHPYNSGNNINHINADANGDGRGLEFHTMTQPAVHAVQKAYVRKVVDTVNDLDNVLYEIANESIPASKEWQYDMITTIKEYESTKPKRHPVIMSAFWGPGDPCNPALFDSPADAVEPAGVPPDEDYETDPPVADGKKVILADSDHIHWHTTKPHFIWKNFLRGNNPHIMDERVVGFDWAKGVVIPDDGGADAIRAAMGHTRMYADRINLAEMAPQNQLCSTAYCLAKPGSEYLAYQPESGRFTVTLARGEYAYEWFNPGTGIVAQTGMFIGEGRSRAFTPPFDGHAVLYLKARDVPRK